MCLPCVIGAWIHIVNILSLPVKFVGDNGTLTTTATIHNSITLMSNIGQPIRGGQFDVLWSLSNSEMYVPPAPAFILAVRLLMIYLSSIIVLLSYQPYVDISMFSDRVQDQKWHCRCPSVHHLLYSQPGLLELNDHLSPFRVLPYSVNVQIIGENRDLHGKSVYHA